MKHYCIKQHDITDCGAACLATVSKQYGLKMPISKIREVAGTDKQGTNAAGMIKAAEKLGFTAKAVKGDQNAFFSEFPLPAIAHVIVDGALLHYVVIHKITKKQVVVADPAKGIVKYSPEEFFKQWTGILILLVPSERFEKGDETESTISRFFKLLLPQKRLLFDIFLASLVYTILGVGGSFYQAEKGEILINNCNIKDVELEALRDKIAYISQEPFLFSGTILENLTLGMDNPDMEEVIRVTKMIRCFDFINELPMRFETMLGENGTNLSGGQRQRLAIARALLKKPDILIMDKATSNLDSITERAIETTINETTDGITTIIIAHRLSTIMKCDKIYVMDKGQIIESGNHFELMDKRGFYYELWKEQLQQNSSDNLTNGVISIAYPTSVSV